jgi:putative phosphoesterase
MIVAVFSDTHDNIENVKKLIEDINKKNIKICFHCGDIVSPFTLQLFENLNSKVYVVFGNNDGDKVNLLKNAPKNVELYNFFGEVVIERNKIAFTHFDFFAFALAFSQKYDFVFFGHTHKKFKKKIGKTILLNPGDIFGLYEDPSYAIVDLKKKKIKFEKLGR